MQGILSGRWDVGWPSDAVFFVRSHLPKMQEVSRQKKLEVLLGYIRSAELFEDHAGGGFL